MEKVETSLQEIWKGFGRGWEEVGKMYGKGLEEVWTRFAKDLEKGSEEV